MKNFVFLLFTSVVIVSCDNNPRPIFTANSYNLNKDVYTIKYLYFGGEGNKENYRISDDSPEYDILIPRSRFIELDREGRFIKDCDVDYKGKVNSCEDYFWGDNEVLFDSRKFLIDNDGLMINQSDSIRSAFFEYERDGNEETYRYIYSSEYTSIVKYKYGSNGLIQKIVSIDSINSERVLREYSYNSKDNISAIKIFNHPDYESMILEECEYLKFDSKGNWIEQAVFWNGEFKYACKREIKYYEECFKELDKDDFVGLWKRQNSRKWIEFFENGNFDAGSNSSIQKSGDWTIDKDNFRITLRYEDEGEKYKYSYEKCLLKLEEISDNDDFDYYYKEDK